MSLELEALQAIVVDAIEDLKAFDIKVLDVRGKSSFSDLLVFACGRSDRQVKSIANNVIVKCKDAGNPPMGVEGLQAGDWVLVDLGDIVVHIMLPQVRDFYNIEGLWEVEYDQSND